MSILYNKALVPNCLRLATILSIDGYFNSKQEPKYLSLGTPSMKDCPGGKLKSRITLILFKFGLSLISNGDT